MAMTADSEDKSPGSPYWSTRAGMEEVAALVVDQAVEEGRVSPENRDEEVASIADEMERDK